MSTANLFSDYVSLIAMDTSKMWYSCYLQLSKESETKVIQTMYFYRNDGFVAGLAVMICQSAFMVDSTFAPSQ